MDALQEALSNLREPARLAPNLTAARLEDALRFVGSDLAEVEARLRSWSEKGVAPGTDAARHLLLAGGKRVRPLLVLLAARAFGGVSAAALDLAAVAEMVHTATLLHDDVLDDAAERRGMPVARRVFGNAVSVLAGDLLLVRALEVAQRADSARFPDLLATLRALVEGEIVQLRGRTRLDPSEETYFRIVLDKTASLFGWAAAAGARTQGASATAQEALTRFGKHLGVAFQLVDDVIDYEGQETGKTLFTDLGEGKITLPLILALREDAALLPEVERVRAGDSAPMARIAARVRELGTADHVRARARVETEAALAALSSLPASPARDLLAKVAEDLTIRVL